MRTGEPPDHQSNAHRRPLTLLSRRRCLGVQRQVLCLDGRIVVEMAISCDFTGDQLWDVVPGLAALSKDLQGELVPLAAEKEECLTSREPTVTLSTRHAIKARLSAHRCDSELSRLIDGDFVVERLTTIFENADATGRGIHAGDFRLAGRGLAVIGTMQGVTNAGVMRDPLAKACEECASPGVMLGRLCGRVVPGRRGSLPSYLRGVLATGV